MSCTSHVFEAGSSDNRFAQHADNRLSQTVAHRLSALFKLRLILR
jgi:hypothetical protein